MRAHNAEAGSGNCKDQCRRSKPLRALFGRSPTMGASRVGGSYTAAGGDSGSRVEESPEK